MRHPEIIPVVLGILALMGLGIWLGTKGEEIQRRRATIRQFAHWLDSEEFDRQRERV